MLNGKGEAEGWKAGGLEGWGRLKGGKQRTGIREQVKACNRGFTQIAADEGRNHRKEVVP